MTSPIDVPDGLPTHVLSLRRIASMAQTSRDAAAITHLDRSAYGQLCQFMVEFFEPSMQVTVDGLGTSVTQLNGLADALLATTTGLGQADTSAAGLVGAPPMRLPL